MLEAINSVIKLLEMDGSFTDMAQKALESAVTTIKLTGAFIIRKNVDGMHLDVIVSYGRKPFDTISITEVPFFHRKALHYIIRLCDAGEIPPFHGEAGYEGSHIPACKYR